jgi:hypothetical protein
VIRQLLRRLALSCLFVLANLAADVLYVVADPRVRKQVEASLLLDLARAP